MRKRGRARRPAARRPCRGSWVTSGHGRAGEAADDGHDRLPVPPARLRVPVLRDLWRARLDVRLRPLRRPHEEQHPRALVPSDGAGTRRHRGSRLRDHPQPARVGGVRSRRRLYRPARRLPHLQASLPRRPARARQLWPQAEQAARRDTRLRPHRAAPVQPHVRDPRRRPSGRELDRIPPPRDSPGHLRELQERRPACAPQAAVRDRSGRQVVPERDHARKLPLPTA